MKNPRLKAEEQIENLKRQREGINKKITDLEAFVKVWDQYGLGDEGESVSSGRSAPSKPSKQPALGMVDYMVNALREDTNSGFTPTQIARRITEMGYKHTKLTPLETVVAQELGRQAKKGNRGIVRSGSRYKLAMLS